MLPVMFTVCLRATSCVDVMKCKATKDPCGVPVIMVILLDFLFVDSGDVVCDSVPWCVRCDESMLPSISVSVSF